MLYVSLFTCWYLFAPAFFLLPFLPSSTSAQNCPPVKWVIEKSSTLKISGTSNISSFVCETNSYDQADTISCSDDVPTGKPVRLNGNLKIEVFRFDCHSRMVTRDLRKTLKADEHPDLFIRFLTLDRFPDFNSANPNVKGWVEIEVAGVRRTFQIAYVLAQKSPEVYALNGVHTFRFSDFQLTPPKKLAGAIQIRDEFVVSFQLSLKPCL